MKSRASNLFVALALLAAGCAAPHAGTSTLGHLNNVLPVPFIAQQPNFCGPAALAMLANFYGQTVTQTEIAGAIYLPDIRGTLTSELADYAKRWDLWVRQYRGSPTDLRQKIAAGVPLIVLGKFGDRWHFFVVLGLDDFRHTVTVHSDTRPNIELTQEEFFRHWDRADRWTLLICPPRKMRWPMTADEYNDLGVWYERNGQLGPAAGNFRAATELAPAISYFQLNLGNVLLKQQLIAEAASAYGRAVRLDPTNADALNNLANAYVELGANLDEAITLCERAAHLRPSHRAYYLDTQAAAYLKQHRIAEAVTACEAALAATTDRQAALRAAIQQRLAAARALLEK